MRPGRSLWPGLEKGKRSLRRSNVLQNAVISRRPVRIEPVDLETLGIAEQPGDRQDAPQEPEEPLVYTEAEYEAARRQAFEEGHAKGFEEGRQSERDRLAGAFSLLETIGAAMRQEREELVNSVRRQLSSLVLRMGEAIGRHALEVRQEQILQVVEAALEHVEKSDEVVVKLNPDDVALVEQLLEQRQDLSDVRLEPDTTIGRGGCRVETPQVEVDATVESLIGRFREALSSWVEEKEAEASTADGGDGTGSEAADAIRGASTTEAEEAGDAA